MSQQDLASNIDIFHLIAKIFREIKISYEENFSYWVKISTALLIFYRHIRQQVSVVLIIKQIEVSMQLYL
jgi:hypothetical protein